MIFSLIISKLYLKDKNLNSKSTVKKIHFCVRIIANDSSVQIHYWCTALMWKIVKMPIADWLPCPPPLYINIEFGLKSKLLFTVMKRTNILKTSLVITVVFDLLHFYKKYKIFYFLIITFESIFFLFYGRKIRFWSIWPFRCSNECSLACASFINWGAW